MAFHPGSQHLSHCVPRAPGSHTSRMLEHQNGLPPEGPRADAGSSLTPPSPPEVDTGSYKNLFIKRRVPWTPLAILFSCFSDLDLEAACLTHQAYLGAKKLVQ